VHEGRAVAVISLSFSETFDAVSLKILVPRIGHYSLDGETDGKNTSWKMRLRGQW